MAKQSNEQLVAAVESRLREEWGIGLASIPVNRLRQELADTVGSSFAPVVVKIPSRSEFSMTQAEAHAVLAALAPSDFRFRR